MRVQTLTGPATISHELHVPLLQAGEVFGVLSLGRLADVPFADADIVLVSHLADQSGVALSKAVVLRELRRRDTITRAVLDAAPNPIALLDDGGHPVVANEPMREVCRSCASARCPTSRTRSSATRSRTTAPGGSSRATSRASTRSRSACTGASSCSATSPPGARPSG